MTTEKRLTAKTLKQLSYREKKLVTEQRRFIGYVFPVCPTCNVTLDREYQSYCDRFGQALSWQKFKYI
jgi:hypothetical protein